MFHSAYSVYFFFNDTSTTDISPLSLHDALPISAGQYFTNDQIKEMTRKVSAEVDLVHQQTQNQRYGSSHIGATAKDISNVVTDAASGVVDIRNILCSSEIGRAVQQECRDRSRMPSSA